MIKLETLLILFFCNIVSAQLPYKIPGFKTDGNSFPQNGNEVIGSDSGEYLKEISEIPELAPGKVVLRRRFSSTDYRLYIGNAKQDNGSLFAFQLPHDMTVSEACSLKFYKEKVDNPDLDEADVYFCAGGILTRIVSKLYYMTDDWHTIEGTSKSIFINMALHGKSLSNQSMTIAVNDLEGKGISDTDLAIISDRFRGELTQTNSFIVMERSQMYRILEEHGNVVDTSCRDQVCLAKIGQSLGVDRIVTGTIGKLQNMYTLTVKMVDVQTAQIMLAATEDVTGNLEDGIFQALKNIAAKFENAIKLERYGSLMVITKPEGAKISLNGVTLGETPWKNDLMDPGKVTFDVTLDSYEPRKETVLIEAGKTATIKIEDMKHTKAYLDSVTAEQRRIEAEKKAIADKMEKERLEKIHKEKKRQQLIRRITFGSLALLSTGAGICFDGKLKGDVNKMNRIKDDYDKANSGFESYKIDYANAKSKANQDQLVRNIFYGIGGAWGIAFVISIPW